MVITAAMDRPQVLMDNCRKYLRAQDQVAAPTQRMSTRMSPETKDPTLGTQASLADCLPDEGTNLVHLAITNKVTICLHSDHATPALATNKEIDVILHARADEQGEQFPGTFETGCGDHKRLAIITGVRKGQQQLLLEQVGDMLDDNEYGESTILDMFFRQTCKEFSKRGPVYEFGQSAAYESWMNENYPGLYISRPSEVGSHYDWHPEIAMVALYSYERDLEFLLYLQTTKSLNKMEVKLIRFFSCVEIKSATKATALLWKGLLCELRVLLNSDDLGLNVCALTPFYIRVAYILKLWSTEDVFLGNDGTGDLAICSPDFSAFATVFNDMPDLKCRVPKWKIKTSRKRENVHSAKLVFAELLSNYRSAHPGAVSQRRTR